MKFKVLLLTISLFVISTSLFANALVDSVGVKNDDGKKVVLYKIKAKDTYYSIGRHYGVTPEAIMKYNGSKKATLSIGKVVMVPTDQPYKKSRKEKAAEAANETKKEKKARLAREAREEKANKRKEDAQAEETPAEEPQSAPERIVVQQPVKQPVQQPVQAAQQPAQEASHAVQYKVSAGETLYGIAKRFNTNVDELTKLNNLTSTNLSPGQVLTVKAAVVASAPAASVPVSAAVPTQTQVGHQDPLVTKRDSPSVLVPLKDSSSAEHKLNSNRYGLYEKNEKGAATWIDDTSLDPNKKLVLHRTAPIGTVIKITNPMTNRTTFAKVVGSFTDSEATKDVIIVMTKNVADSLGALDKRFYVTISYGSPNE